MNWPEAFGCTKLYLAFLQLNLRTYRQFIFIGVRFDPFIIVLTFDFIHSFAEIIPQSLFTRHGLYLGAQMAGFTKVVIYALVSSFLIFRDKTVIYSKYHRALSHGLWRNSWSLCSDHIMVSSIAEQVRFFSCSIHHRLTQRPSHTELKELIAMHSNQGAHGGDLKVDTITIIGATLDLQEKVVRQAMTPISDVFMLSIDSQLDYALLKKICQTGHSRVPVYEEVDVPVSVVAEVDRGVSSPVDERPQARTRKVKKIIGILLVKQCVLLDPKGGFFLACVWVFGV
jgi:metal transporter CNNM